MSILPRRFARGLLLLPLLAPANARAEDAPRVISPTVVPDEQGDDILVTGSRRANASINGLDVAPLLLPQNVRILGDELVEQTGFTDLSQMFDLAGGMSRQNSFGGAWDAYAIRGFSSTSCNCCALSGW